MSAEADDQNFEELMSHTNVLNRKLEEVYGVGKEFTTVADLWGVSCFPCCVKRADIKQFNALIRAQQVCLLGSDDDGADLQNTTATDTGVAGTGGANFGQSTNQA